MERSAEAGLRIDLKITGVAAPASSVAFIQEDPAGLVSRLNEAGQGLLLWLS